MPGGYSFDFLFKKKWPPGMSPYSRGGQILIFCEEFYRETAILAGGRPAGGA